MNAHNNDITTCNNEALIYKFIGQYTRWGATGDTSRTVPKRRVGGRRSDFVRAIAICLQTGRNQARLTQNIDALASDSYTRGELGERKLPDRLKLNNPSMDFNTLDAIHEEINKRFDLAQKKNNNVRQRIRKKKSRAT